MTRTECTVTGTYLQTDAGTNTGPKQPTLTVSVPVSSDQFESFLEIGDGTQLIAEDIDIVYRYKSPIDDSPADGVLSAADKITGRFIVEASVMDDMIASVVESGMVYAEATEDAPYKVVFECEDGATYRFEQYVLLVYGKDNSLLRQRSLIPNNITV